VVGFKIELTRKSASSSPRPIGHYSNATLSKVLHEKPILPSLGLQIEEMAFCCGCQSQKYWFAFCMLVMRIGVNLPCIKELGYPKIYILSMLSLFQRAEF
jgi:hypothetical protein